ncbi:hypothetical protein ACOMHN_035066 [Nucella lapillus]
MYNETMRCGHVQSSGQPKKGPQHCLPLARKIVCFQSHVDRLNISACPPSCGRCRRLGRGEGCANRSVHRPLWNCRGRVEAEEEGDTTSMDSFIRSSAVSILRIRYRERTNDSDWDPAWHNKKLLAQSERRHVLPGFCNDARKELTGGSIDKEQTHTSSQS